MPLKTYRIEDRQFDSFLALCGDEPGLLDTEAEIHSQEWDTLLEHRNALNRARATLRADAAGRALSDDERGALTAIRELVADVQSEINLRDERNDRSPRASSSLGRKTDPDAGDSLSRPLRVAGSASASGATRITPVVDLAAPVVRPTYSALFGAPAAQHGRQDTFTRFLAAVATRDSQYLLSRPQAAGANTMVGAEGGFAVPHTVSAQLLEQVVEQSQFLRYCRVLPMEGKSQSYPVLNIRDRTKGPAQFTAQKVAEGGTATRQTPKMDEVLLTAHKKITYWSCTSELLQDAAPGTSEALIRSAAGTLAMELDREIVNGSGTAEGIGVNSATCTVIHAKDGSQTADTVSYTNLSGMVARLTPSSFNNAIWVINPNVLPQLFGVYLPVMQSTNVVGGLPAPLTQGPDGSYRLFGRPLVISDFAATLGDQADIMLVDLSWLVIGVREDLRFEVSRDFLFSSDEVAFRVVTRRDVQPVLAGAITPAKGSATLSPFVVLAERA